MKITTLVDVLNCLNGKGGVEIILSQETISNAKLCIDKMLELGGA